MKKIMKALAVILTVCILAGAIAIFASAEGKSQLDATQYGEGISNYKSFDFENYDSISNFMSAGAGKDKSDNSVSMSAGATYSFKSKTTVGGETNTYASIVNKPQETPAVANLKTYPFIYFFLNASGDTLSGKYDYVTVDFDIAATGEGTYLDGAPFGPYMVKPTAYPIYVYTVTDGENWYLSNNSSYAAGGSAIRISDEIGVWNHVSFIFNVKGAADSKMPVHVYVNGAKLCEASVAYSSATEMQRLTCSLSKNMTNESYNYGVDNIVCTKYATGYTSTGTGIDDFIAGGAKGSPELLSDVIYRSGYSYTAAVDDQFFTVDDGKYVLASDASNAIEDGSVVSISRNLHVTKPGLNGFTVKAKNGAKVSFDAGIAGLFVSDKVSESDGVVTYNVKRIVDECPDGVSTQASYIYDDGNLKYNTYLQYSGNFSASIKNFDGNQFAQITDASTATLTKNGLFRIPLVDTLSSTTEQLRVNYDYQILDFDISTSSNYYANMDLGIHRNVANGWSWIANIKDDGNGGYRIKGEGSEKTISISKEECDWIHFTAVITGANGKVDIYVNGEYLHTTDASIGAADRIERLDVFFKTGTTVHPFTLNIDNVILRDYKKGYNSGDAIFGIDDYKALGDKTLPIYGLGDTVYGPKYGYDSSTPVDYTATSASGNYYVPTGAFFNAKNGDTITLTKDVTLIDKLPDDIKTLNIVGGNVNLAGKAAIYYSFADGVLAKNSLYTVNVYDENGNLVDALENKVGNAPDVEGLNIETEILGNYNQALAWLFSINGGEELPLTEWSGAEVGDVVDLVPNVVSVAWNDNYGEFIDVESWFAGSAVARDFSDLEELDLLENGWYELAYFWFNEVEGNESLTVTEDSAFTAIIKPVEAFTGLKVNYTLSSKFRCNYYVPVPMEDGVTVTSGRYAASLSESKMTSAILNDIEDCISTIGTINELAPDVTVQIGADEYYKFQGTSITAYTWYASNAFEVRYTVEYEGETYEFSSKVALTRIGAKSSTAKHLNYVDSVMKAYDCGEDEKALVVNWMRYINYSYKSQGSNVDLTGIAAILENHADCGCLESLGSAIPKEAVQYDTSGLTAFAEGIAVGYSISHTSGVLAVYVPTDVIDANSGKEIAITSTFKGIDNESRSIKDLTYQLTLLTELDEENSTDELEVYVPVVTTVNGIKCYSYLMSYDAGIYNINAVQNIAISIDGEVVAKGTYSLAAYLYNRNQELGLYKIDETSGEYVVDETKLVDGAYSKSQIIYECALALAKFGEAAYEFKIN